MKWYDNKRMDHTDYLLHADCYQLHWKNQKVNRNKKGIFIMLNHITLMGRLTRDPELRHTGSGTACANFTIAVDRDFGKNENGEKETDFIECVAWRQTGEFVSKYFTKGRMAVVSGRLQIRSWTDKDGNKRKTAEVVADQVYFGDSKKDDSGNSYTAQPAPVQNFEVIDGDDSSLPF